MTTDRGRGRRGGPRRAPASSQPVVHGEDGEGRVEASIVERQASAVASIAGGRAGSRRARISAAGLDRDHLAVGRLVEPVPLPRSAPLAHRRARRRAAPRSEDRGASPRHSRPPASSSRCSSQSGIGARPTLPGSVPAETASSRPSHLAASLVEQLRAGRRSVREPPLEPAKPLASALNV